MITATSKTNLTENPNNEFLQARNKLKKVSSNGSPSIKGQVTIAADAAPQNTVYQHQNDSNEAQERTLAVITLTDSLDDIIEHIKNHGFTVLETKSFRLSTDQATEFYKDHQNQSYYDKYIQWLSGSMLYALILEKQNAIKEWKTLMGPSNYKKARKSNPTSIRALFGKDASQNATHGSDSEASAKKEIEFIFSSFVCSSKEEKDTQEAVANIPETIPSNQQVKTDPTRENQQQTQQQQEMTQTFQNGATSNDETPAGTTPDTVSSTKEKANNDLTLTLNARSNNDANDHEKVQRKQEASSVPAIVNEDGGEEGIESVTDKTIDITIDKTTDESKNDDKNARDDQTHGEIPEQAKQIEEEGAIVIVGAEATKAVNTESEDDEKHIGATSHALTENEEEEEGITPPAFKTQSNQNECDSAANNKHEKEEDATPLLKQKNDNQVQNEKADCQDDRRRAVSMIKVQQGSNGKLSTSDAKKNGLCPETAPSTSPKSKTSGRNTKEALVKGETVRPSTSRIRPPSIKRGQDGTMVTTQKAAASLDVYNKKQATGPERKLHTSVGRAKASTNGAAPAGATRIARLSNASTNSSSSSSEQEKKPSSTANPQAKKPLTKVSKHLPRVATIAAQKVPPPTKKETADATDKPKKRASSTKSFISRLTAPTVASANKKTEHTQETVTQQNVGNIVRRTTSSKKPPTNSSGAIKPKQKKKEDKVSSENNANNMSELHESPITTNAG